MNIPVFEYQKLARAEGTPSQPLAQIGVEFLRGKIPIKAVPWKLRLHLFPIIPIERFWFSLDEVDLEWDVVYHPLFSLMKDVYSGWWSWELAQVYGGIIPKDLQIFEPKLIFELMKSRPYLLDKTDRYMETTAEAIISIKLLQKMKLSPNWYYQSKGKSTEQT